MEQNDGTPVTLMQRVRLQADVLVPVLRRLREELGEQAANDLVYPAVRAAMKGWIAEIAATGADSPVDKFFRTSETLGAMFVGDVDMEVAGQDDGHLSVDVTGCRFADFFRQLGEPELGAILTCELDDHIVELFAPEVALTREATIMQGAAHCPFRYRFVETG